jgi:hypothetical protein
MIVRGEDDLAAIGVNDGEFLLGFGRHPTGLILVALGEKLGLDQREILQWCRFIVDDDVVDFSKVAKFHRAQVLGNMRPIAALGDVDVRRQTGDENIGLGLA